ncbi:MAG: YceD family protein [Gammaproteobacteria bacterium]
MSKSASKPNWNPDRLDIMAMAQAGGSVDGQDPLAGRARLADEAFVPDGQLPATHVSWSAKAQLREGQGAQAEPWLHLQAAAVIPLCCQRCLQPVDVPLAVDRWFRFVADEATAEAQDDECEEDVLALEPRPSLHELVEDELLMAVPLVPMHEVCPQLPPQLLRDDADDSVTGSRPNPFAALSGLKRQAD